MGDVGADACGDIRFRCSRPTHAHRTCVCPGFLVERSEAAAAASAARRSWPFVCACGWADVIHDGVCFEKRQRQARCAVASLKTHTRRECLEKCVGVGGAVLCARVDASCCKSRELIGKRVSALS